MNMNGILNNNNSIYKIYILGNGFEITQGALPMETVNEIYNEVNDNSNLVEYFIDAVESEDKLNWFDVDDNFHAFGPDFWDSTLYVEDSQGLVVFKRLCNEIENYNTIVNELYPEDFQLEQIGVLTCIEKIKGTFFTGYLDATDFNMNNIKLHVKSLGNNSVVQSIEYNKTQLLNTEMSKFTTVDFIAYL